MVILYESAAGHTKRFAEMLAGITGMEAFPRKGYRGGRKEEVLYLGWVRGGKIAGLKKAGKYPLAAIAGVGLNPASPAAARELAEKNAAGGIQVFALQGGYDPAAVKGLSKLAMKAMQASLEQKDLADTATAEDKQILHMLKNGCDFVNKDALAPIVSWYHRRMRK